MPSFHHQDETPDTADMDPDLTLAEKLHGAVMVFGSVTHASDDGGVIDTSHCDGNDMLFVEGITAGTWKIRLCGGDSNQADEWYGDGNENGTFTYGNWDEIAISYLNPSGISLGTKPDSGSNSIQILGIPGGGAVDPKLIFDENATFNNITIDSGATLDCGTDIVVTYTGSLTNNGSLGGTVTHDASAKTLTGASSETKSHSAFGRGDGGKTSFLFEAAQDLDQPNWVENYFLDQENRLG